MSDEKKSLTPSKADAVVGDLSPSAFSDVKPVDPSLATTEISFCPRLGIYHYKRADGTEYFFDSTQLEKSIKTYQEVGDLRLADFMVQLTSWAREFPHKLVTIFPDSRFEVRDLASQKPADDQGGGDQGGSSGPSSTT
jgi:hypothetical protein